jgi:predicted acyl esterase
MTRGRQHVHNYQALSKAIKGPVYLIMGPWIHGQQGSFAHGQVSFGQEAAIPNPRDWRLEWFDKWLRGIDNSVAKSAPFATPVRIFVMGTGDGHKTQEGQLYHGGFWRDEQEWPWRGPAMRLLSPTRWWPIGRATEDYELLHRLRLRSTQSRAHHRR